MNLAVRGVTIISINILYLWNMMYYMLHSFQLNDIVTV